MNDDKSIDVDVLEKQLKNSLADFVGKPVNSSNLLYINYIINEQLKNYHPCQVSGDWVDVNIDGRNRNEIVITPKQNAPLWVKEMFCKILGNKGGQVLDTGLFDDWMKIKFGNKKDIIEIVTSLLNMEDGRTSQQYFSWDKGDCSEVGIIRILLMQSIRDHIKENGEYADKDHVNLLKKLEKDDI